MSYSMTLANILALLDIDSDVELDISSLTLDSRNATAGSLFFAYPGVGADGRDFMSQAEAAGAVAILYEAEGFIEPESALTIPAFAVHGLQHMVGYIAHEFYARPSTQLQVFGVTGTNGKTTCCYLLTQAFSLLGMQAAMIGTIGVGKLNALVDSAHTTPDPIALHARFAEFRDQGITQVCIEVSSHALDQGRVNGTQFFCTLFTNLSHDHLDYHGDMNRYADAKRRLFVDFHSELVVANAGDRFGSGLIDVADADFMVSYGLAGDVYADEVTLNRDGICLLIDGQGVEFEFKTPLVGKVNVPNLEMLVAVLLALSTDVKDIQNIGTQLTSAPGRMERYSAAHKPQVVVDYAHTPDALEKALLSVREHCLGQLWCVFGCGGDRDKAKRPIMGAIAEKYADRLIVTNDNPRTEVDAAIANEVASGIAGQYRVILDRAHAIDCAITQADEQDWVLVAGKGHETTQEIGDQVLPFSDREQVAKALEVAA